MRLQEPGEQSAENRSAGQPVRPRDAAATRRDLLRVAKQRFTVVGYERTTTRDIAAAAGVNVSLIARYFGSKDGLYAAVLEDSADTFEPREHGDLVEDLIAGLRDGAWPEFGDEHPLLLLLRGASSDQRTAELRRRALGTATAQLAARLRPDAPVDDPVARLDGATVLALIAGIVALRAAAPDSPLRTADEESLRAVVQGVVDSVTARRG